MAINHFFTEYTKLNSQSTGKGFGPVSGNENTQFRTCSLHSATSNPKAIVINNGTVAVQKITGSSPAKVNLILKPYSQGSIDGFRIKYFIYRGILESSLFNGNEIASSANNDLTKLLWDNQNAHNAKTSDTGNPPEDLLGIQYQTLAGTNKVEKLFFDATSNFVNPCVFAGWYIGDFDQTEFGIQVVTENYHSDLDLNKVRALDHIINIATYPLSGTDKVKYENKALREAALSYIDPSAFYGLNFESGVRAIDGSGNFTTKKELDIFNDLLVGSSTTTPYFLNFDVLYIDFRNDKGLSKNFYEDNYNYDLTNFQFSGETTSATKNFSTNDWPLLIIRSSDHSNATSITDKEYVSIIFDYPISTVEVTNALFLATGARIGFFTNELEELPQNNGRIWVFSDGIATSTDATTTLLNLFGSPYHANNNFIGSYYLKLQTFESKLYSATLPANHLIAINHLDNCFTIPKDEKMVSSGELLIQKTGHTKYLNLGYNRLDAVFEFGVAWEENRVIFFGMPIAYKSKNDNIPIPFSFDDNLYSFSSFYEFAAEFLKGLKVAKHELNVTGGNIKVVRLIEELFTEYWQSNEHDVISIAISRTEFQNILGEITSNNLDQNIHPVFLNNDLTTGTDSNSVDYSSADLKLVGFEDDGTTISELHVNPTIANLADAYAVDLFTFSTDDAADEEGVAVSSFSEFFEGDFQETLSVAFANSLANNGKTTVFNVANQTNFYKRKLAKMFREIGVIKIKFDIKVNLPAKAITYAPGSTIDGVTQPADTVVIRFDESFVQTSSNISFVKTLYHELLHAYVKFLFTYLGKSKSAIPGLYDFYCRFGAEDDSTIAPERSYSHNYMAAIQRHELVKALKEYDALAGNNRSIGSVDFLNIFNNNLQITESYSIEDFYQAMSWDGLWRTRSWRELARKNQIKTQAYITISYNEYKGAYVSRTIGNPSNTCSVVGLEFFPKDFDYPNPPTLSIC